MQNKNNTPAEDIKNQFNLHRDNTWSLLFIDMVSRIYKRYKAPQGTI